MTQAEVLRRMEQPPESPEAIEPGPSGESSPLFTKDYLWLHLRELPYFRALLRAVEARFYVDLPFPGPILDLGCGDGHFASSIFDQPVAVGVDPLSGPLRTAAKRGAYRSVVLGSGCALPFKNRSFASAISNSSLEHISDPEGVLAEVNRVLQPGAPFVFCVPNPNFLANLTIARFLDRARLKPLAALYRRFFNWASRHHHADPPQTWKRRLAAAGFQVEEWWHYFSPRALGVLEWGHYLGVPAWVAWRLTGRAILSPTHWNLAGALALTRPVYEAEPLHPQGAYTFYRTRKLK